jgi:hypothetical protein
VEDDLKVIADLLARAQRALLGYRQRLLLNRDAELEQRDQAAEALRERVGDTPPVEGDTPPAKDDTEKAEGDTKRDTPSVLDRPIWPERPQPPTEDSP